MAAAERPDGPPVVERDPRGQVHEAARDLAKHIAGLEKWDLNRLRQRGTAVEWTDYATFHISVHDPEAPPCIRDCFFWANFERGEFDYNTLPRSRSPRGAFQSVKKLFGSEPEERVGEAVAVPPHRSKELLEYLKAARGHD
ncbi:MAG: hypothetical protein Q8Q11_00565 [bacterium]|nr:hypothetical protein [bacterium]MDZ4248440.1 hypothetical protein [Patescibacteria group bacterium]